MLNTQYVQESQPMFFLLVPEQKIKKMIWFCLSFDVQKQLDPNPNMQKQGIVGVVNLFFGENTTVYAEEFYIILSMPDVNSATMRWDILHSFSFLLPCTKWK